MYDEKTELVLEKDQVLKAVAIKNGKHGCYLRESATTEGVSIPSYTVKAVDTTGAGDSFCAGAAIGLTYGKTMREACEIGSMLAASVIVTTESVCPRFLPRELGLDMDVVD